MMDPLENAAQKTMVYGPIYRVNTGFGSLIRYVFFDMSRFAGMFLAMPVLAKPVILLALGAFCVFFPGFALTCISCQPAATRSAVLLTAPALFANTEKPVTPWTP